MELDNMKELWQKMDDSIRQQQTMNENIIKRMLQEKNAGSVKGIMNMEWLGIFIIVSVMTILLGNISRVAGNTGLMVCYITTMVLMLAVAFFGLYKLHFLTRLDAGTVPVSDMAEKMQRFRLLIAKERIVSLFVGPVLVVACYVVILFLMVGINALDNPARFIPLVGIAILAYIVTVLLLYKKLYFEQIEKINNNLREIEEFKK